MKALRKAIAAIFERDEQLTLFGERVTRHADCDATPTIKRTRARVVGALVRHR